MSLTGNLLPGLLPGLYRGVTFFAPDVRNEAGRRVAEHMFPGVDRAAYDDMGLLPETISVAGLMVGDDYKAQAAAMRAAFCKAGPGLLIHPWLGPMQVMMLSPGEISFSAAELRVARFSASFTRIEGGGMLGAFASAASALTSAASALRAAATGLAGAVK